MSFLLTTRLPKENQELQCSTPIIVDGCKWCLVANFIQYQPYAIEAHVACQKFGKSALYTSKVSLIYPGDPTNRVDQFDTSQQLKSNVRTFTVDEIFKSGDHFMSVTVRLNHVQPEGHKNEPCNQSVPPIGAKSAEQQTPTPVEPLSSKICKELENQIAKLKKENEENFSKIDGKYEERCAKMEQMVRKLEERLQATEAHMETQNQLEEETENLTNQLEKMKVSKSEGSLKEEIEHLKAELEVANRKMMEAEKKVELMQRVLVETEADLNEKNEKLKLAMKTKNCTEREKVLAENLKAKEAQVNNLIYNLNLVQKKMESVAKVKDEKIARFQGYCKDYLEANNTLHNQLRSGNEQLEQQKAENEQLKEKLQKIDKECDQLSKTNDWLKKRNTVLLMTEEEKEQHDRDMRKRNERKEKKRIVKRRQYVEDLEKEVKELKLAAEASQVDGTVNGSEVQVPAGFANEYNDSVEKQEDWLDAWRKQVGDYRDAFMNARKPSFLEEGNNRLEENIVKKLEQMKDRKLVASTSQEPERLDVSDDDDDSK